MRTPKVSPGSTQWGRFPSLRGYSQPFRSCAQPHRTTTGYNRDVLAVRTTRKRLSAPRLQNTYTNGKLWYRLKERVVPPNYILHDTKCEYTRKEGPIRSGTLDRSHSSTQPERLQVICYLNPTSRPDRVMLAAGLVRGSELTSTQSLRYVASSLTDHTLPSHCGWQHRATRQPLQYNAYSYIYVSRVPPTLSGPMITSTLSKIISSQSDA